MKKTLTYLLVVLALVALASTASAITCTIDQHPAATLLVPYFQVHLNADGSIDSSATRTDTLVTVVNASSSPVLAHVTVWNRRSVHILDFNIALTPFDVVSWSMEDVLTGALPNTPDNGTWKGKEVCQRNSSAKVYPDANGFLRFVPDPKKTPSQFDNSQATTQYGGSAFGPDFAAEIADVLDYDDNFDCDGNDSDGTTPDGTITGSTVAGNGNLSGYVTIDMANYCSLGFPDQDIYWQDDAAGWENDLMGDYIIVTNSGLPTLGSSTVNVEAALDTAEVFDGTNLTSLGLSGSQPFNDSDGFTRTFYARYWSDPNNGTCVTSGPCDNGADNNGTEGAYLSAVFPYVSQPFGTYGDNREPLGVRYAVRYLTAGGVSSFFRVWRGSAGELKDLTGDKCSASENAILAVVWDEDENTTTTGGCPSPCPHSSQNFPYETQRTTTDALGTLPGANGWAYINFLGTDDVLSSDDSNFDQAWMDYELSAGTAFVNASIPATQLDPSTCDPAGITDVNLGEGSIFGGQYPWPVGLGH